MVVDLRDYSRTAAQRGWGAGWPADRRRDIVTVTADRSGTKLPVHSRISRLVDLIVDEVERRGYALVPGWCWGYANRAITGTKTASNHSWGLAVDVNAPNNPYTTSGNHDIPDWVADLFNRYGFAWGGDYSGARKDWMHFEFMGTPNDADTMTALAMIELGAGMSATDIATLLERTKQQQAIWDDYYAAAKKKYGQKFADTHGAGQALFDVEQVIGGYYAEAQKKYGTEFANTHSLGAELFRLVDQVVYNGKAV